MDDASLRRPHTAVSWFKDGELLDTAPRKYRAYGRKRQLLINSLSPADMGVYECATPNGTVEKGRAELWSKPL